MACIDPVKLNLTIYQGATFCRPITWSTQEAGGPESPVDLTGYEVRMHIRERLDSPEVLLELTTDNGRIVITDATAGAFELRLTAEETEALDWRTGVYDLEMVAPDGPPATVVRLLEGRVKVVPEVTRGDGA